MPAKDIKRLKFMLGASDGKVTFAEQFVNGQKIEVIRGPFRGLQGVVLQDANAGVSRLYVNIDMLGSASVEINPNDIALHRLYIVNKHNIKSSTMTRETLNTKEIVPQAS